MVANLTLDEAQVAFLLEHHDIIDALFDLAQSDDFKVRFGDLSVSEVIKRFENTIQPDDDRDAVLRQRYARLKAEMERSNQDLRVNQLRGASLFDDLNQEDES